MKMQALEKVEGSSTRSEASPGGRPVQDPTAGLGDRPQHSPTDAGAAEPRGDVQLAVPAETQYVTVVRLFVSSLASASGVLSEDRIEDLKVAVSEACTNAIEAYGTQVPFEKRVLVRWREGDDFLEVSVEDEGPGFDPDKLAGHLPVTDPKRLEFERGLGIPLIRTLVDEVTFVPSSGGTLVSMVMRCERAPAAQEPAASAEASVAPARKRSRAAGSST